MINTGVIMSPSPYYSTTKSLLNRFKDHYSFENFNRSEGIDYHDNLNSMTYEFDITNQNWRIDFRFKNNNKTKILSQQYQTSISFKHIGYNRPRKMEMNEFCQEASKKINEIYQPDFSLPMNVINWFVEEGKLNNAIHQTQLLCYEPKLESHLTIDSHCHGQTCFIEKKVMQITHDTLVQDGKGYQNKYYKKSILRMEIVFMIHSDNTLHPYFKLMLPYNADKKITCFFPFEDKTKVILLEKDKVLKKQFIDTLTASVYDENKFKTYFNHFFKKEVVTGIAKKLEIDKSELIELPEEKLDEYLTVVNMLRI